MPGLKQMDRPQEERPAIVRTLPVSRATAMARLRALRPHQDATRPRDALRIVLGSFLGVLIVGLVSKAWVGSSDELPWLVAPLGASAVLVFAVPASPLSQPWAAVAGCVVSAFAGIAVAKLVDDQIAAAAIAVAAAIGAMALLRCLHPPGGAVALTAVLGGAHVTDAGWSFATLPVGLNVVLLVGVGVVFNNAMGHTYPHVPAAPVVDEQFLVSAEDVDAALQTYGERLDVDREDMIAIVDEAVAHAQRRHG